LTFYLIEYIFSPQSIKKEKGKVKTGKKENRGAGQEKGGPIIIKSSDPKDGCLPGGPVV
jgi:hypothetical protein